MIRKATLRDVKAIHRLISEQAKDGHILLRALTELYALVRDFTVHSVDGSDDIVGCGALHFVWEDLAEIRSLAVTTDYQHKGIGTALIEALLEEARQMEVKQVFVLANRTSVFERCGFTVMEKNLLPHKIWADCLRCTKFPDCDEIALARTP